MGILDLLSARGLRHTMKSLRTSFLRSSLCFLLLMAVNGLALDPSKRITQYQHKMWRVQDGLLPNDPEWLAQTNDGYILGGSSMGFFRFDGVRFGPWSSPISTSSGNINLLPAKSGGFWIGDAQGLFHVKGKRVISHFDLPGQPGGMFEDADGSLWLTLLSFPGTDGPPCHVTDLTAKCFGEPKKMPFQHTTTMLPDGNGGFWFGADTGLAHWRSDHSEIYEYKGLKSNAGEVGVTSLVQDPDGSLWVGIARPGPGLGLEKFDGRNSKPFVTRNLDGSKLTVLGQLMDHDQNLWVATARNGLYRIHGESVEHFGKADGLSSDLVNRVYEDREGIIWVTTSAGIDSFADRTITTFSQPEGLSVDAAVSVMASRDGTVWLAEAGSLDYIRNGEVFSIRSGAGLPGSQVTSLFEDRAGQIWVGVDDSLFLYIDKHFRRLPEPNHRPLGMVQSITEDVDGNIWAECRSNPRKLVRIRDFQIQEEFSSSQVPAGHTLASAVTGGIWVSTLARDLVRFQNGAVQTFPLKIKGELPRQIEAELDGSVLVAAPNDALIDLRPGSIQRLTKKNGLPCDGVLGFARDDQKNWWLEAPCGYLLVADSEMQRWFEHPDIIVQYQLFDALDGARNHVIPFNPATKSPDGRLWFASFIVQTIDPRHLVSNKLPPPVHIEQMIANRKAYEVDSDAKSNVGLPPRIRDLEIDYTALSLVAPEKVRFRYKLEGRDTDWQEPETRRQAYYTDLRPGKYRFRVIACNNSGVWNEEGASLDFNIAPAWYQTNWFRAACGATFLLLLWFVYQLRVRQLHRQFSIGLEARVNERTRIARDLHDTLLQSFHGLLLRFQTVYALLPSRPEEAKQSLGGVIDQAAQAITESRDAVQGLRSSAIENNDLAAAIRSFGEELSADEANRDSAAFQVQVEGTPRNLNPILRDEVYRIACEALRNAFQHSKARQIEAEIRYDGGRLRLRIRDDGEGIDPTILGGEGREGHYGLHGMRERAEVVGGKLTVWSNLNSGTEVELCIPAAAAYVTSARRSSLFENLSGTETQTKREP
jgi:signal transduction histidine kinase/ligand-binding sensor domain-containing protein